MALSLTHQIERRQHRRWDSEEWPEGWLARLRPGQQVRVLNLSSSGALIESAHRLSPGGTAAFCVETGETSHSTRAAIIWCSICEVRADGLLYRGALAFECLVPWLDAAGPRPRVHVGFAVTSERPLADGTTQPHASPATHG